MDFGSTRGGRWLGVKLVVGHHGAILSAAAILGVYGVVYFGVTYFLRCR